MDQHATCKVTEFLLWPNFGGAVTTVSLMDHIILKQTGKWVPWITILLPHDAG
jgi:hypothetical protein